MDFQNRINQFRQNMDDQQKSYNNLASTASNYGRTIVADQTAKHYAYMEQVSGMTTGGFALLHGTKSLAKRIQKYRKNKQAKANNQTPTEEAPVEKTGQQVADDARAENVGNEVAEAVNQGSVEATAPSVSADPIESLDIAQDFDHANRVSRGGYLNRSAQASDRVESSLVEGAQEASQATQSLGSAYGTAEDALNQTFKEATGSEMSNSDLSDFMAERGLAKQAGESSFEHIARVTGDATEQASQSATTPSAPSSAPSAPAQAEPSRPAPAIDPDDEIQPARPAPADAGPSTTGRQPTTGPTTEAPADPIANPGTEVMDQAGENPRIGNVARGGADLAREIGGQGGEQASQTASQIGGAGGEEASAIAGRTASTVAETATVAEDTANVASKGIGGMMGDALTSIGTKVGSMMGEGALEIASDAVPFLGEAVGLGMLIDNIVKSHKHEENAGPPKLTQANPEATEQSGGINTMMLQSGTGGGTVGIV